MKFCWCLKGVMHCDEERRLADCLEHLQTRVKVLSIMIKYYRSKMLSIFKVLLIGIPKMGSFRERALDTCRSVLVCSVVIFFCTMFAFFNT